MSTLSLPSLFDQWAATYDKQPNPLLALEERTLPTLMPDICGKDVLDVGCGTGRWLRRLEALSPSSLTGTDSSPSMLEQARTRLTPTTILREADAASLPLADCSCDLILCSFVLGYVDDLAAFASECVRLLRPGGTLLLSDMHPVTAVEHRWSRTFYAGSTRIDLPATHRSLKEIIATFTDAGLSFSHQAEPAFDLPERHLFESTGKLRVYDSLTGVPAIYLLRLRKQTSTVLQLINAPWASDASTWNTSTLCIEDGRIASANSTANHDALPTLDLTGYVLLPGLINAHDHLEFALFPNLGRHPDEAPYRNATEWAHEIHTRHAATIAQHLQVPLATRLWWGAIRNLLCGVTTVCHHNPNHPEFAAPDFPIRIASKIGWSHSLAFAKDLLSDRHNTPEDQPFLLHAAEGVDVASRAEIYELDRRSLLDHRTVLIHGLALEAPEVALLNRRGCSVILCPTSNDFLFHQTMSPEILAALNRVALGSDSPLTAAGDLLDEIHHLASRRTTHWPTIYHLVTTHPAAILHLQAGTITPGAPADLIAIRNHNHNPAHTLAGLTIADIELVMIGGTVQLASPTIKARLSPQTTMECLNIAGHQRYIRAPLAHLFESAQKILGPLHLGNREVHHVPTA